MTKRLTLIEIQHHSPAATGYIYGLKDQKPTWWDNIFYHFPHKVKNDLDTGEVWHHLPNGWIRDFWFQ